ncbi:MAG: Mu-like prophage major head subunit gpT family protein [Actinomycetota bacterium]|nr:Mu-like prophage major head subunit gpT family protein [Actinomycetota bacterium]
MAFGPSIAEAEKYASTQIGFHVAFMDYYERNGEDPLRQLAMEVSSKTAVEEHIFLGDLPGFEEWKDDRKMSTLAAHKLRLANRNWASGIRVHRNEIMDDQLGLVMPRLQGLAAKARRHVGDLIAKVLINGFSGTAYPDAGDGLGYDGSLFFSDAHVLEGGASQDNKGTTALTTASYEAAIMQMRALTTYDGSDPLDFNPTHLLVGPKNEFVAKRIVGQLNTVETAGDGSVTNIHYGSSKVIVSSRLSGAYDDYWFLLDLSQPVKPLIFQNREPITVASQTSWESDDMFRRGEMKFGAQARYNVGLFDWRLVFGALVA